MALRQNRERAAEETSEVEADRVRVTIYRLLGFNDDDMISPQNFVQAKFIT